MVDKEEKYIPAEGGFARPLALSPCVVETTGPGGRIIGTRVADRVFLVKRFLSTWIHVFTESRLVELKIDKAPTRNESGDIIFTSGTNVYVVRKISSADPIQTQNYAKRVMSLEERLEQENTDGEQ